MRWCSLLSLVAACGFSNSASRPDDANPEGPPIDAPPDAPPDAFDPLCYGGGAFYFCLPAMPMGSKVLGDFNTQACNTLGAVKRMVAGGMACVVDADIIENTGPAGISGDIPLVLVAREITISGNVDAGSFLANTRPGPAANDQSCKLLGIDGTYVNEDSAGSGGAGGSFATAGGNGGNGANGAIAGGTAGAAVTTAVDTLRGGCRGGNGQPSTRVGGDGGGAIYIVAREELAITGVVNASGAAGMGGSTNKAGGAGGGSGGMIVLHAGTLTLGANAKLVANGGGGGGGGGQATAGTDGFDVDVTMPEMVAQGGSNGGNGGTSNGGDGASRTANALAGQSTQNSGGGGGGGRGIIRILAGHAAPSTIPATTASPTPTN